MNRQTASAPLQQQEHLGLIRLIGWTREGGQRREEARQNNGQRGHTLGGLAGGCIKCQKRRNNKNGTTEFGNGGRTEGGGGRFGTLGDSWRAFPVFPSLSSSSASSPSLERYSSLGNEIGALGGGQAGSLPCGRFSALLPGHPPKKSRHGPFWNFPGFSAGFGSHQGEE